MSSVYLFMLSRRKYPSDLTDEQWECIKRYFRQRKRGRKPLHSPREIVNAIFYILRTGCPWRHLPKDLPPWGTVAYYFSRWKRSGKWRKILAALTAEDREQQGRLPEPSAVIIDSQSVKTTEKGGQKL
ncbi:MAG: IS5 family transposase [Candidatus Methanosuratincola sp.]